MIDHESFHVGPTVWIVVHVHAAIDFGAQFAVYRSVGIDGQVILSLFSDQDLAQRYIQSIPNSVEFMETEVYTKELIRLCSDLKIQGFTHVSFDLNPAVGQHRTIWTIGGFISECRKSQSSDD